MHRRSLPALGLSMSIAVLAAGACSSSSSHPNAQKSSTTSRAASRATTTTATRHSTTTTAASTSTTAPANPDAALAARAALTVADLPPGFTPASLPPETAAQVAQNRSYATCVGADPSLVETGAAPTEARRLFVDGNIRVTNTVHIFPSSADVTPRFNAYTAPATARCLAALFKAEEVAAAAKQNVQVGTVTATPEPITVRADHVVAWRLTAPLTTPQAQLNDYVDLIAVSQGRAAVLLQTYQSGQPYSSSEEATLLAKVLGRLGTI